MLQGGKQTQQNGNDAPAAPIKVVAALVHHQSGPGALLGTSAVLAWLSLELVYVWACMFSLLFMCLLMM